MIPALARAVWMISTALVLFAFGVWAIRTWVREKRDVLDETPAHRRRLDDEAWLGEERRRWR